MASAALDWVSISADEIDAREARTERGDVRPDEHSVRVLLIEDRPALARVVCWALERAARGRFAIELTHIVDGALDLLHGGAYDAILLDLGERSGDQAHEAMDAAEALSHRVPVIVLTGTCIAGLEAVGRDEELAAFVHREHVCCERLPCAILDAIRRQRRVGQGGAEPVIYRMHE